MRGVSRSATQWHRLKDINEGPRADVPDLGKTERAGSR
jgi:hypothetical protein